MMRIAIKEDPVDADRVSLERLQIAVAELFKAVSDALQVERQSAEERIRRACAILRIDLAQAIPAVAAPLTRAAPAKSVAAT